RKRRQLTLGHVVAPALDHLECAVRLEDDRGSLGMLLVYLAIGRGHRGDESIDVTHGVPPFRTRAGTLERLVRHLLVDRGRPRSTCANASEPGPPRRREVSLRPSRRCGQAAKIRPLPGPRART